MRSVLALFVASTEFRRWINVLESHYRYFLAYDHALRRSLQNAIYFIPAARCLTMLKLRGLKQDVAKSSEPKMQEGILVFKWSYNLVPWFVSTLQEKGLCTILPLEEQKNCANQSLNAIHGQNNFSSRRGLYYYSPLVSIRKRPVPTYLKKKYDK